MVESGRGKNGIVISGFFDFDKEEDRNQFRKRRFSYRNVFPFYVSFILIVMSEATDYGTDFAVTSLSLELY